MTLFLPALLACSGSADITITDLNDPTGILSDDWSASSAIWYWSDEVMVSLWSLSASSGLFEWEGDVYVDNLSLSTEQRDCGDLQDSLDDGATLLEGVERGDTFTDHCDALTVWFEGLEANDEERTHLGAYHEELTWGQPEAGTYTGERGGGALFWGDGKGDSLANGWDAEACTYTPVTAGESEYWNLDVATLVLDDVGGPVQGTLTGTVEYDYEPIGSLEATFEAELCEIAPGAAIVMLD